jgi:hypothetical protein
MMWATIATTVGTVVSSWFESTQAKAEQKAAVQKKKLETIQQKDMLDAKWELEQAKGNWQAGFLTIVFSIPLIAAFVPSLTDDILRGFEVIQRTPEWYRWMVGAMVGAAFGYKDIKKFFGKVRR